MHITLEAAGYNAVINDIGANLSSLTSPAGHALILPAPPEKIRMDSRGALLAPWANRIENGLYTWVGTEYQLPINEVDKNNAIHGLVDWARWSFRKIRRDHDVASVTADYALVPQPGYPFALDFSVTYTLDERGLTTDFAVINQSKEEVPYGVGAHPYLVAGSFGEEEGAVDKWSLTAPVSTYLEVNDRMIPLAHKPVSVGLDLAKTLPLQGVHLDHAFGGLIRNAEGESTVTLTCESGDSTSLTVGESIKWLQFYTDGKSRRGVAVEPMTAPANAFNNGVDLLVLAPGELHSCWWRISGV